MPSIHDVEITVNAENCCNGCCFPRRKKEPPPDPKPKTTEKVKHVVRRMKSSPT